MNRTLAITLAAGAACLAISGATHAAPTVYTSQSSFLAALSNPAVDTFNNLPNLTEIANPLVRSVGAYSYTATAGPLSDLGAVSNNGVDIWLSTNESTDTIKFSGFSPTVRAVGAFFFGTDVDGKFTAAPSITVSALDASGLSTRTISNPMTGSFLGFINSAPFTSLTVALTGNQEVWPTVNDLTLGAAAIVPSVPEPSTWALMACGLVVIGARVLKKRSAGATRGQPPIDAIGA